MSNQLEHGRRTQALEAQIGRLNAQLGVLKKRFKALPEALTLGQVPSWDVVRMQPASALSGADWDPLFDDETATNRITHSLQTSGGEIAHVNSDHSATRLRIRFTSQGEGQVLMKLGMVGSGQVQVKANGTTTSHSSGAFIPVTLVSPPLVNELVVMADGFGIPFQISLDGLLFDGVNRKWVSY